MDENWLAYKRKQLKERVVECQACESPVLKEELSASGLCPVCMEDEEEEEYW